MREITEDKPKKEQEMADVKTAGRAVASATRGEPETEPGFRSHGGELRSQLEEASGELAKAKLTGANAEETARLTKENEMLRKIVMRERQEEARRERAKKLMLAEFESCKSSPKR